MMMSKPGMTPVPLDALHVLGEVEVSNILPIVLSYIWRTDLSKPRDLGSAVRGRGQTTLIFGRNFYTFPIYSGREEIRTKTTFVKCHLKRHPAFLPP